MLIRDCLHRGASVSRRLALCVLAWALSYTAPLAAADEVSPEALEIPFYTGTILPTPQKVTWHDELLELTDIGIILGSDIEPDDPHVAILADRIAQVGGKAAVVGWDESAGRTAIALGNTPSVGDIDVPDRKEGYAIRHVNRGDRQVVVIKGHDRLGLLWAIASLNQLMATRSGQPVLRKADVYDYPVHHHRGFISGGIQSVRQWAHYVTAFKFSVLQFYSPAIVPYDGMASQWKARKSSRGYEPDYWRKPPPQGWLDAVKELGQRLTPLGIDWYLGLSTIRGKPEHKIDSRSDEDFEAVMKIVRPVAEAGGGMHFHYDDSRFPMSEADVQNFGTAREADIFFFNRLYSAVREKHPSFKMTICPPFYWGPQYEPLSYGESRDAYLRAMGERLPKEIGVYWTGRAVWGGKVVKKEVEWVVDRIRRKPWFWQNGTGLPHMYGYHYYTDPVDIWQNWHYDGFFHEVNFTWPTGGNRSSTFLLTMIDYLWNPSAHNPDRAVEDAAKKLTGPETWPALVEMNKRFSKLDRYEWKISASAFRNISQIEKDVAAIDEAEQKCLAFHPEAVKAWTATTRRAERHRRFLRSLKARAKRGSWALFTKNADALKQTARKEADFDPSRDTFLSPYDFHGGKPAAVYGFKCEKRLATWVYGAKTDVHTLSTSFRMKGSPTKTAYDLVLSAQDDDREEKCRIQATVNNNVVFAGENPFVRFGWSRHTLQIDGSFLKEGTNTIQIKNTEDCNRRMGPPFFMLNYAFIKGVQSR